MSIRAQLFDGSILEFPDGTDQEVINRVAKEQTQLRTQTQAPVAPPPSKERTWGEAATDIGAGLVSGLGGLLQVPGQLTKLVPGLYGVGEAIEKPGEAVSKFGESLKSEGLKVREALRSEAITQAEKDGILSEFVTAIGQTIKDPALLSTFLAEQLPQLIGPAAAVRAAKIGLGAKTAAATAGLTGQAAVDAAEEVAKQYAARATKAAVGTGAVMQGADIASDTYDAAFKAAKDKGLSDEDAQSSALNAARLAGVGAGGISVLAQRLPGAKAIEKRLAGSKVGEGRLVGALGEAASEAIEEGGGAFAQNLAIQQLIDQQQSLTKGIGTAAGLGVIGGGVLGGVFAHAKTKPEETDREKAERLFGEIQTLRQRAVDSQEPLALTWGSSDPYVTFADGSVGRASEVENYIKGLPEDQQTGARAKLFGKGDVLFPSMTYGVMTKEDLKNMGIAPNTDLHTSLLGKNIVKEGDDIRQVLTQASETATPAVKENIQNFLTNLDGLEGKEPSIEPPETKLPPKPDLLKLAQQPDGWTQLEQLKQQLIAQPKSAENTAAINEIKGLQTQITTEQVQRQAAPSMVIDDKAVKLLGFAKSEKPASIYQNLINRDLAKPEDFQHVTSFLTDYRNKHEVVETTRQRIDDFLSDLNALPTPMTAEAVRSAQNVGQTIEQPSGTGPEVAGKPSAGVASAGPAVTEPSRVVPPVAPAAEPAGRTEAQPVAVAEPVAQPPAEKPAQPITQVETAKAPAEVVTEEKVPEKIDIPAQINALKEEQNKLLIGTRIPATKSKARKRFDALERQITDLRAQQVEAPIKAEEPVKETEVAQTKARPHVSQVMGSPLLALVSKNLRGLDPSLLSEFSFKFATNRIDKNGRPITQYRNPLIPGVGKLFRSGGESDYGLIAEMLERAGYLEPGTVERSPREAGERAKDLIKKALEKGEVLTVDQQIEQDAKRREELDKDEQVKMDEARALQEQGHYQGLDEESAKEAERERQAIMEEAGIDKAKVDAMDDADIPFDLAEQTDEDISKSMRQIGFSDAEIQEALNERRQKAVAPEAVEAKPTEAEKVPEPGKAAPEQVKEEKSSLAEAKEAPEPKKLSKEIEAKIDELGVVLERMLGKMGLENVAVNIVQDLKANGEYANRLIKLAIDAESPVRDLRHESLHAMKELGFFSDAQWQSLEKMARDKWVDKYLKNTSTTYEGERMSRYDAYMRLYGNESLVLEEAIADAFGDFDSTKAPPGLMNAILNRMRNFFRTVKEAMGIQGIESAEDIFRKAEKGELKEAAEPAKTEAPKPSLRGAPETKEFKKWFGDSKVVDEKGEPLVVYHGTQKDFSVFEPQRTGESTDLGFYGPGAYFTNDPAAASRYAQKEGGRVMPVYLSIQKPYVTTEQVLDDKELKKIRAEGYDGIISEAAKDQGYIEYIVFKPEQIKSATGNVGVFGQRPITAQEAKKLGMTEAEAAAAQKAGDIRLNLRSTLDPSIWSRIDVTTVPREQKTFVQRITEAIAPKSASHFRAAALNRYNYLSEIDKKKMELMGGARLMADASAEAGALNSDLAAGLTASAFGVHDRKGGAPVYVRHYAVEVNNKQVGPNYDTRQKAEAAASRLGGKVYERGHTIISNQDGKIKGPLLIFAPLAKYGDPEIYRLYQFWAGVKRGSRFMADGREELFKPGDIAKAEKILKDHPEFEQIQKEWIAYNNELVKFMRDTGVISAEGAKLMTEHGDYFPFYRQLDEEADAIGPKVFQSIGTVRGPKKIKHGETALGDFLENVVRNSQAAIHAGIKNIAARRAADIGMDVGVVDKAPIGAGLRFNQFTVMENGIPVAYETKDSLFIDAVKSLHLPDMPFIGLLSGPANLLRNLVTKDPAFMLANMMRDSLQAWTTSGLDTKPMLGTLGNFAKAIAGKSPGYEKLLNAGLLGGMEYAEGVRVSAAKFGKELRKEAKAMTPAEKALRPATYVWEALEKGTTASDAATRIEVYKKTLEETGNEAEALFRALEVMNFNRKGSSPVIRILTAAVPFLNARMQGLDVLYRAALAPTVGRMKYDIEPSEVQKQIQKTFFVRGMTMAALACMYWALTHDDDDYKRQEQETRDNYWLLPKLGIKIPIPFEVGVMFKVIPERIMAYAFGDDTGKDFIKSMGRNLWGTLGFNPIPQAALPIVETMTNYSFFTGRSIIGQGMEGVAPEFQVGPETSKLAEAIGKGIDMSPIKIDYLLKGYTGTIGMYMSQLMDSIFDNMADSPKASKRFEQMPFIRRFAVDPLARGQVTSYYDMKNEVDEIVRTSNFLEKTMDFKNWGEYMQDNMKMLSTKSYISDMEKSMKQFREMKNLIRISTGMSADEKRDALAVIAEQENKMTENVQTLKKRMSE